MQRGANVRYCPRRAIGSQGDGRVSWGTGSIRQTAESSTFVQMNKEEFSHINKEGDVAMVNVSQKAITRRMARAEARMFLPDEVIRLFEGNDLHGPKGPVFQTARIAGIQAAKRTGELIPLCHPLGIDAMEIQFNLSGNELVISSMVEVNARTGVEMEALTAASIAALTVYDMCKAVSHDLVITQVQLIEKTGGKRDFHRTR